MMRLCAVRFLAKAGLTEEAAVHNLQQLFCRAGLLRVATQTQLLLDNSREKLAELQEEKNRIDAVAKLHPQRYAIGLLLYLIAQNVLLFHWVYFKFDWNLVEPITYLIGYSNVWLAIGTYIWCGKEFSYNDLRAMIVQRKSQQLYRSSGLDFQRYSELKLDVAKMERTVRSFAELLKEEKEECKDAAAATVEPPR